MGELETNSKWVWETKWILDISSWIITVKTLKINRPLQQLNALKTYYNSRSLINCKVNRITFTADFQLICDDFWTKCSLLGWTLNAQRRKKRQSMKNEAYWQGDGLCGMIYNCLNLLIWTLTRFPNKSMDHNSALTDVGVPPKQVKHLQGSHLGKAWTLTTRKLPTKVIYIYICTYLYLSC